MHTPGADSPASTPSLPSGTPEGTPPSMTMMAELATLRQQYEAIKDELKDKNEELRTLRGFVNEARRKARTPAKLNRRAAGDLLNTSGSCLPDTPGRYAGMPSPPAELRAIAPTPLRAPHPTGSPPVTPKGIPPLPLGKLGLIGKTSAGPVSGKALPPPPPKTSPILTCLPPRTSPKSAKGSPPPTCMNVASLGKASPPPPLPTGRGIPPLAGPKVSEACWFMGPPPRVPTNLSGPKSVPKARVPNPYVALHIKGVDITKAKGKRATACSVSTPRAGGAGSTDSGTDTPLSCDSSFIQAAQLEHAHDEPLLQYFTRYGSRPRDFTMSECGTPRSCASDADTSTKSLLPVMPPDCIISRQVGAQKIWKRVDSKFLTRLFKKKEVIRDLAQKAAATGKELENPLGTPNKPLTVFGTKEHRLIGIVAQKVFMQMEPPPAGAKLKSRSEQAASYRNLLLRCDDSVWQEDQLGPVESLLRDLMIFLSGFEEEFRAIEVNLTTMYRALEVMYDLLDKFALVLQLCVNFANALNPGGRQIDMFQLGAFSKFYELKCTENPRVSCLHCVIALMSEEDVKALLDRVVIRCIERAAELRAYRTVDDVRELTDSFHDIEHALEKEREREKKRRLTSMVAEPQTVDDCAETEDGPLDTFHTHLAEFYRDKIAESQWLFDYGLNVYASYRNLCMTFVDYDSVWPPPKERGPDSKDLFEVCRDMLTLIAKVEQDIHKLKLREQFQEQYPTPTDLAAGTIERGQVSSPICITPPIAPSTPSTIVSDGVASKALPNMRPISRFLGSAREKENISANISAPEPERVSKDSAISSGDSEKISRFPNFSHLNSPPPSPPSQELVPPPAAATADTFPVSWASAESTSGKVSDLPPQPPLIPALLLAPADQADVSVESSNGPVTDDDVATHPTNRFREVLRERPPSILTENEAVDGSSMSELDQSSMSVSSARSTLSVKSTRVSGSQDFRPPPISSNGGVSKRQTSKHGSESREAERLRRRLESRKSMTNSVARILKRKNPQLEESILPDSEEEDFGSGRLASVLNGILVMRASE
ncbi:hypothetical protein Pmar_PMAR010282 [Perkinsus marinus ATCC 50983]|uniref:FH2 domain-containing protein n=1 Tax=Perkinsus marinus (strain ATCC 50983 / TXsc) TaxID=423536 RepID=C5K5B4_PERM5|nr:hypothetical protein Pmar_PMAR010282 [Perkinsus marinus ATCC 50983]EER20536.1 hypothetical protein Pmar_PMAR010282 [Perkinsus marinus ATCC 50983]|eukprot:XP_002788740.1 hypothetical protein Pmar_PMAR010282 [Perkinsus marinus ATCC 50983]